MEDNEVERLKKEIERLNRRNKIITKRVKKLEEANKNLINEIEELEALNENISSHKINTDACPECGDALYELVKPNGAILFVCNSMPRCSYRRRED